PRAAYARACSDSFSDASSRAMRSSWSSRSRWRLSVWTSVTNRSRRSRTASNFRSERSRAWSTAAILEAAPPRLLLRRCRRRLELGEAGDRRGARPESLEQELLRSRPGLERVEPACDRELCGGDAGQRLGPVGEGADMDACRLEPPKRCVHLGGR